jgi:hypothetical protein
MKARFSALALLLSFSLPAWAHGGHGHFDGISFWHYLTSPEHAFPMLMLAVVVIVLGRLLWKTKTSKEKAR